MTLSFKNKNKQKKPENNLIPYKWTVNTCENFLCTMKNNVYKKLNIKCLYYRMTSTIHILYRLTCIEKDWKGNALKC